MTLLTVRTRKNAWANGNLECIHIKLRKKKNFKSFFFQKDKLNWFETSLLGNYSKKNKEFEMQRIKFCTGFDCVCMCCVGIASKSFFKKKCCINFSCEWREWRFRYYCWFCCLSRSGFISFSIHKFAYLCIN